MTTSEEPAPDQPRDSSDDEARSDSPAPPEWLKPYDTDVGPSEETPASVTGTPDSGDPQYSLLDPPETWKHSGPDWHRIEKVPPVPPPERTAPRKYASFSFLARCNLLVFLASVCIMVLELTASRLIARHVGSSLYTWTSVIGVVLAGITVGNFAGGWLAERFRGGRILSWLFFLASLACFSVLWLDRIVATRSRPEGTDWPVWVFLIVAEMFFLPAVALGTISPVVASLAIRRSRRMGLTVGNVYAWGALGSIAGTFLTGFWLIDQFGTRMIIGGTSAVLALLGILVASGQLILRTALAVGWMQFLLLTTAAAAATSDSLGAFAQHAAELFARRDPALKDLADWYHDGTEAQLAAATRDALKVRQDLRQLSRMDAETLDEFRRWCRSGNRHQMNERVRSTVEALIQNQRADAASVRLWRARGESLGLTLNELGLLLFLRSDLPGEYHDESNYSYINVSATDDGETGTPLLQLRLDKLVHSYYDPEHPERLHYEYENIYAEVTEQVTGQWGDRIEAPVADFDGRGDIVNRLPDWVTFDASTGQLSVTGTLTAERRRELLALAPPAEYWLAVEELATQTREPDWEGFSSVRLTALPEGAGEDEFLVDRLTFESTFNTLNVFRVLSESDVERLCAAGAASRYSAWRTAVNALSRHALTVDAFFIGGGGYVFPRWIEQRFSSQSRIDVAELDPAVKLAVQRAMWLPPDDQTIIRTLIGDARNTVDDLLRANERRVSSGQAAVLYDFVYGDAFNDFSVPWHLTTREFVEKVRSLLKPERGVYLINIIDFWPRTVWPDQTDGTYRPGLASGFPAAMAVDRDHDDSSVTYWDSVPRGLAGFEASAQADGTQHFAVRGVMPESLRTRLRSLAASDGSPDFLAVLDDLFRRSRRQPGGRFLASCTATLADVFPHVYVFSTSPSAGSVERDTFVLVASRQPLDLTGLEREGTHWKDAPFASMTTLDDGTRQSAGQMDALLAASRGLILTDNYAPVDHLLRPVFEQQDD